MMKTGNKKINQSSKVRRKPSTGGGGLKNHLHLLLLGVVVLITFMIYRPALDNQFTNWDDNVYVTGNPHIKSLSGENLAYVFSEPIALNYHPLTIISLALNYKFAGLSPFSYYLVNILFHLFNILLVYWFVMTLFDKNRTMALFIAALFAVHPMHVESVAWVAERKDVLYTFFFLGGLISYLSYIGSKKPLIYLLCLTLFLLSALSKPTAVIFPLVLLLIDYLKQRKGDAIMFVEKIPFFVISIWIGLQTINSQTIMVTADMENYTILQKFIFASYGFSAYILKLFVPTGLSAFYPFPLAGQPVPWVLYLTPLVNTVFIAAAIYSLKFTRVIFVGLLFYFLAIALTLQLVQVGQAIIADRYTYVSYIGLLIAVFWIIDRFLNGKHLFSVKLSYLVFILFFLANTVVAFQRVPVWQNSETLWNDVIKKIPTAAVAYNNRGLNYFSQEKYPEALADYNKAIGISPRYVEVYYNRGGYYLTRKTPLQAIADFSAAITQDPDFHYPDAYQFRADAYVQAGKPDSALLDYTKHIQIRPGKPEPFSNRANFFMKMGKFDQAVTDYKAAIELQGNNPDYWFNLGAVYGKMRNFTEAQNCFSKTLEYKPDYYEALTSRAMAEASLGKGDAALNDLAEAIRMAPGNPSSYFTRAIYFLNNGKNDQACADLQKAAQLGSAEAGEIYQQRCGK